MNCHDKKPENNDYLEYYCEHYDVSCCFEDSIISMDYDPERREKLLDLAAQHVIRSKYCSVGGENLKWHFFYDSEFKEKHCDHSEYVNLATQLADYPEQVIDVANRTLLNLAVQYSHYGDIFQQKFHDHRLYFHRQSENCDVGGIFEVLIDLEFLKIDTLHESYIITAKGWQKIDELRKEEKVVRQAFIAMIFREEASPIREAFRRAIHEMGYRPVILDEKEHNNQIVPEIFYEIKRSKFVVVDVTYPSYGAYYEAGYAQALEKEVIICCRKDVFSDQNRAPHFDISQKAIIVWEDEEDLVRRLKSRIEATVT